MLKEKRKEELKNVKRKKKIETKKCEKKNENRN